MGAAGGATEAAATVVAAVTTTAGATPIVGRVIPSGSIVELNVGVILYTRAAACLRIRY